MPEASSPSMVAENYLACMYRLDEEGETGTVAKLTDLLRRSPPSERLGLALPSVMGMLRRLAKDDLIQITAEKTVRTTVRGRQIGESVVRRHRHRHRLAERLLADMLHVDLPLIHVEAHRLVHAISPEVEDRINDLLGRPATCPFGYPIPGNAAPRRAATRSLGQVLEGERWLVDRVPEDDTRLLDYLVTSGVLPGVAILMREVAPYKGTMTLDLDGRSVVIGNQVAVGIRVRKPE